MGYKNSNLKPITVWIDKELKEVLKDIAKKKKYNTVSEYIRDVIRSDAISLGLLNLNSSSSRHPSVREEEKLVEVRPSEE